jgi:hypothetical protein
MSQEARGNNWLYRRLDAASAQVDGWTKDQKQALNYVWNDAPVNVTTSPPAASLNERRNSVPSNSPKRN